MTKKIILVIIVILFAISGAFAHSSHDSKTWTAWTTSNSLPSTAGSYYLNTDVTLSDYWEPAADTYLCLNGHKINLNTYGIDASNGNLNLYDCNSTSGSYTFYNSYFDENITVSGGVICGGSKGIYSEDSNTWGGALRTKGTCNIYGGTFCSNSVGSYGGAISVGENSTLNFYGGTVCGNTSGANGGGLYVSGTGTLNVYGGSVYKNYCSNNGAGFYSAGNGKINISGPAEIYSNTAAKNGGGLYAAGDASLTVNGTSSGNAKIYNNTAVGSGGGIGANCTISIGQYVEIYQNTAANGGALYEGTSADFTIDGTKIYSNTVTGNGGAVYMSGGKITIKNSAEMKNNSANYGGGIYAKNKSGTVDITISGGTFSGNTATKNGGCFCMTCDNYTFTMTGGTVSGNTAAVFGGAISAAMPISLSSVTFKDNKATGKSGGAIYTSKDMTVKNCTFDGNSANILGGAIVMIPADGTSNTLTISDTSTTTKFTNNSSLYGGGAISTGANATASLTGKVEFTSNTSVSGGALYVTGSTTLGSNVTVNNNTATNGAGVYAVTGSVLTVNGAEINENTATGNGGGIYSNGAAVNIINTSTEINSNSADKGGGLYIDENSSFSMTAGTVIENTANSNNGILILNDAAVFGGSAVSDSVSAVYTSGTDAAINLSSETPFVTGASLTIYPVEDPVVGKKYYLVVNATENDLNYIHSSNSKYPLFYENSLLIFKGHCHESFRFRTDNKAIYAVCTDPYLTEQCQCHDDDHELKLAPTTDSREIDSSFSPADATNNTLIWSSNNPKVATVTSDGVVHRKSAGTAIITAVATDGSGKSVSCTVTVTED